MNETIKIYELILQRLQQPFVVDSQTIHFACSTLGIDEDKIAEHLLEDNGIVDLVIVPDEYFRKVIEPYIPDKGLSTKDIDEIVHNIEKAVTNIIIEIDGTSVRYNNLSYCRVFINKLYLYKENITIPQDKELRNRYITARIAIRLFVKHHNLQILKKMVDTMVMENSEAVLYDSIKLFTSIVYDETDIYSLLSLHKQRLQKQLWDMYEFRKLLNEYSMEFLMSIRRSSPIVDGNAINYQIQLIDTICISLFGKPAAGFVPDIQMEFDSDTVKKFLNNV